MRHPLPSNPYLDHPADIIFHRFGNNFMTAKQGIMILDRKIFATLRHIFYKMSAMKKIKLPPPYEYLDHPADIIIHGFGNNFKTALEATCLGMFNYITPLNNVSIHEEFTQSFFITGHDLENLVFKVLDELLFLFCTEFLVCKKVAIDDLDFENYSCNVVCYGEIFDLKKHIQGTEIKAITMHNFQYSIEEKHHLYVTVDI